MCKKVILCTVLSVTHKHTKISCRSTWMELWISLNTDCTPPYRELYIPQKYSVLKNFPCPKTSNSVCRKIYFLYIFLEARTFQEEAVHLITGCISQAADTKRRRLGAPFQKSATQFPADQKMLSLCAQILQRRALFIYWEKRCCRAERIPKGYQ